MKEMYWNVLGEDGITYKVHIGFANAIKNSLVAVADDPPRKLKEFTKNKKESNLAESVWEIPVGGKTAKLYTSNIIKDNVTLTVDGLDCKTGEEYIPVSVPKWVYIFFVLYVFNLFFVIGGAVGGAVNMLFAVWTLNVATKKDKKTSTKLLSAIGIYVLSVVVGISFQFLVRSIFNIDAISG